MKLSEKIYLAGSGAMGLHLTNPMDCNVFLLDGGSEAALIDAGGGVEPERIVRAIESDGLDIKKLKTVLLTHAHGDHAAGATFWRESFGCKIYSAAECVDWIRLADESKISLDAARAAGIYPPDFKFAQCEIERGLHEGDEVQIGDTILEVLETPGHARGHISFYERATKALFSGDVVFPGGKIAPQVTWDFSILDLKNSIVKIHDLGIESLFAGHGAPLLNDAANDVAIAHKYLQQLRFPKPLV